MKNLLYKLSKSIVPCFLMVISAGFTYAFSIFAPPIALTLSVPLAYVTLAFYINIFFLGIGAAIFGKIIQNNIKKASIIATVMMFIGFIVSGIGVLFNKIFPIYIGYGVLCGISEGIFYCCPVLNNILWFKKYKFKGVIAALSIIFFGLGSTTCSALFPFFISFFWN